MTKREMFVAIKAVVADNEEMVKFIDHEIELLDKSKANRKPTKTQQENEVLCNVVIDTLKVIGKGTITEIGANADALKGLSNQKVTALVRTLVDRGVVVKNTEGKKSVFSLAE